MSTFEFLMSVARTIWDRIDELDATMDRIGETPALIAYDEHLYDVAEKVLDYAAIVM